MHNPYLINVDAEMIWSLRPSRVTQLEAPSVYVVEVAVQKQNRSSLLI
jgi:hypothetical protein